MSLISIFDVAGSALSAQSVRLNLVASNLANANTISGNPDQVYRSRQPVFATMMNAEKTPEGPMGVKVAGIVESKAPARSEYAPHHPLADKNGYVYSPNVNAMEEMANMISASRSFQSSIEVLNTSKQLLIRTLQLGE